MVASHQKIKNHVSPMLAWFICCLCVLFVAATSRSSFYLINDKFTHAFVFCLLSLSLGWRANGYRTLVAIFIGLFLVGCGIELAQTFVPHRHASLSDVLANVVGLSAGLGISLLSATRWLPTRILTNSSTALRVIRRFDWPKSAILRRRTWSDPNPYIARIRR